MTQQLGFFAEPPVGPDGLRHVDNFIDATLEQALSGRIAALPLRRFQFGAFEGNRRVASFGYRYDYSLQRLTEAEPIPDWAAAVARRVEAWAGLPEASVRQVLCTEYEIGVGIGWHRDKPHFDKVLACRSARPASSVSAGAAASDGSGTRSKPCRARST